MRSWMQEHKANPSQGLSDLARPANTPAQKKHEHSEEVKAHIDRVMNPQSLADDPCPKSTNFRKAPPKKYEALAWDYYGTGNAQTVVSVKSTKHTQDAKDPYFVLDNGIKVDLNGKVHGHARCVVYRDDEFVEKHERQELTSLFHCFDTDRCPVGVLRKIGNIIKTHLDLKERRTNEEPEAKKTSKIDASDAKDRKQAKMDKSGRKTTNKTAKTSVEDEENIDGFRSIWSVGRKKPVGAGKSETKKKKKSKTGKRKHRVLDDF